jgi:hypothetical protein
MALAALGKAAHRRDEHVICFHADRLLRGQWKTIAIVEKPSSRHVLAAAPRHRDAADYSGAALAPFGAATPSLNRALLTSIPKARSD